MEKTYNVWVLGENGKVTKGTHTVNSDVFANVAATLKEKVQAKEEGLSL